MLKQWPSSLMGASISDSPSFGYVMELRIDPLTGIEVQVTGSRQSRPNRPTGECPFCVGGTEAPEPYEVLAFKNRWPSYPDDRCEVVLFSPEHNEQLATMPVSGVRKVIDLWAQRTEELGKRDDISYVLAFENNGAEVGATIPHPHGQIYSYPDVPPVPSNIFKRLSEGYELLEDDRPELTVIEDQGWRSWVPSAPIYPFGMRIAPLERRADIVSLSGPERDGFALVLKNSLAKLAAVLGEPMPYIFWIHQRPTDGNEWPQAWMHVEIMGPHRSPGVMRYVAGAELGSGHYLNPIQPEDAAQRLREVNP